MIPQIRDVKRDDKLILPEVWQKLPSVERINRAYSMGVIGEQEARNKIVVALTELGYVVELSQS